MIKEIADRWKLLSGQESWSDLLDPLDFDLRRYIIHYGEMAQATYDNFNAEKASKYAGSSLYSRKDLFSKVGVAIASPFRYQPTKYLYATSEVKVPQSFIFTSSVTDAWSKDSNWIGYVAVATDEGKSALGRRDILIAWRGTKQTAEWIDDFDFPLVPANKIFGDCNNPKVHRGWLSIYTSSSVDPQSLYNKTSARDQVLTEVKRLLEEYQDEEISITVTGHSMGGALGMLNAADLAINGLNRQTSQPSNLCPVTAFLFASPRVGDSGFKKVLLSMKNLHILRINNTPDLVPLCPTTIVGYTSVGEELMIDTRKSNYLRDPGDLNTWHNLEAYLHGVAGTQGSRGEFNLVVKRDISLVNKEMDALKDEYPVPASWWCMLNKGMVQLDDGSWTLEDHETDES